VLSEFAPLKIGDENEKIVLIAVGMDASAKPKKDFFNSSDSPTLAYFFSASVSNYFFFTSGELTSPEKGKNLVVYIDKITSFLQSPAQRRVVFMQLNPSEESWNEICTSHSILAALQDQFKPKIELLHLNLPAPTFFKPDKQENRLPKTLKMLHSLSTHLNMEAWVVYCSWIKEEMKILFTSFKVEAAEDYRLEAKLYDFVHEIDSDFLQNLLIKIKEYLYARENTRTSAEQFSIEKQLVIGRLELVQQVQTLLERINSCLYNMDVIHASTRQEFKHLGWNLRLLKAILSVQLDEASTELQTGLQFFALVELFHQLNGVLCCSTFEQGSFIFCLRVATGQILTFFALSDLIEVFSQWDQLILQINLEITHQKNSELLTKPAQIVKKFRELIYQNLINISFPLKKIASEPLLKENEIANPLYYNFLPNRGALLMNDVDWKVGQIVIYDALGEAQGYTHKSLAWLKKII